MLSKPANLVMSRMASSSRTCLTSPSSETRILAEALDEPLGLLLQPGRGVALRLGDHVLHRDAVEADVPAPLERFPVGRLDVDVVELRHDALAEQADLRPGRRLGRRDQPHGRAQPRDQVGRLDVAVERAEAPRLQRQVAGQEVSPAEAVVPDVRAVDGLVAAPQGQGRLAVVEERPGGLALGVGRHVQHDEVGLVGEHLAGGLGLLGLGEGLGRGHQVEAQLLAELAELGDTLGVLRLLERPERGEADARQAHGNLFHDGLLETGPSGLEQGPRIRLVVRRQTLVLGPGSLVLTMWLASCAPA